MPTMRTLRTASGAALTAALLFTSAPHATADQVRDDQWALKTLQAKSVWQITKGKGQVIAVIDSTVDADHPDLKGNVLLGKDFTDGSSTVDDDDHGTAMAAEIAGHGHGPGHNEGVMGLAPEAEILSIHDDGDHPTRYADSIRYAVDHGATVINISQGSLDEAANLDEMQEAVAYALQHQVVIVAASGNEGKTVSYPAALPGVVAVSGVAEGGHFWKQSGTGKEVMLSAPAAGIVSAGDSDSGYVIGTGTSDATAYTSAAVALLKSKFPDLSAGQIVNRLTETAVVPGTDRHADQRDERWGYGAIRPLAALTADIPKGSTWGPLQVPTALKEKAAEKAQKKDEQAEIDKGQAQADRKAVIIWAVIGLVALIVIVLVLLLIVRAVRKKNRPGGPGGFGGPGGPGMPGGGSYAAYPPGQQAAPGYAYPPQQQQQPPAPPQHNPYT